MRVAVMGSGGGALATAAQLGEAGKDCVMADLPQFAANLAPVKAQGGVKIISGWAEPRVIPVRVAEEVESAVVGADLVLIVVPCFGHEAWAERLAPVVEPEQRIVFFGEGGGSLVLWRQLREVQKPSLLIGETNTLPYAGARVAGPGAVTARRKGGVYFAALPSSHTPTVLALLNQVWPRIVAAESIWETVLVNYNAIDHVAAMLANVGTLENRTGHMLLWGEGASRSVVRLIEAIDGELLDLRRALGLKNLRRYGDFLVEQDLVPALGQDLYETVRASGLMTTIVNTGPRALETRLITEDVPYALVLMASLGRELGVPTPTVHGLIAIASAMMGRDFWSEGRSLATLGLDGLGVDGLREFAKTGRLREVGSA